MHESPIRYSQRTCTVFNEAGDVVGKILFQREQHFKVWRIRYLSDTLPVHSFDTPQDVRENLDSHGLSWSWGRIRHYYGYQRQAGR